MTKISVASKFHESVDEAFQKVEGTCWGYLETP